MLLLKQEQPAWLPRLSLLAALGFTSAMVSDYGADFAWCVDSSGPATDAYVVSDAIRTKYGRYPPWCRLNVDQVPLPFVNDMEQTYEVRGAKRVIINQLGPALSKRQATGQVCFRPAVPPRSGCTNSEARRLYDKYLLEQPAPCIIFRGKGNISEVERAAYPQGLVVLWQDKAWVDRPLAVEWVEDVIKPFIEAERRAGVAMRWTRYLLFQDNLDSQKQPEYIDLLKEWCVDDHKLPPNETEQVQPIDRGFGRQIKIYLRDWGSERICSGIQRHTRRGGRVCTPPASRRSGAETDTREGEPRTVCHRAMGSGVRRESGVRSATAARGERGHTHQSAYRCVRQR